jgi:hypothetical protein
VFANLAQDGTGEGIFFLDRLPNESLIGEIGRYFTGRGGRRMNKLRKLIAAGDLHKAADLMKVQLSLLEEQLADADRRLSKLESKEDWPGFYEATPIGAGRGQFAHSAGDTAMNLYHGGGLDKLAKPADLQKDHRYRARLSIKALAEIIAEADPGNGAAVREMLDAFLRALASHDHDVSEGQPQRAAERLAQETDMIVRERALAAAVKSSLQKGMSSFEFHNR